MLGVFCRISMSQRSLLKAAGNSVEAFLYEDIRQNTKPSTIVDAIGI